MRLLPLCLILLCAACATAPATAGAPSPAPEEVVVRGEPLQGAPEVPLAQLIADPAAHEGQVVQVSGKVHKACERKGCWMELSPEEGGPGIRVTFRDYGFFVPTDSEGMRATVEGEVERVTLSDPQASHLEEEGATVERTSEGQASEVRLLASGVELRR